MTGSRTSRVRARRPGAGRAPRATEGRAHGSPPGRSSGSIFAVLALLLLVLARACSTTARSHGQLALGGRGRVGVVLLRVAGSLGGVGLSRAHGPQTVLFLLDASDSVSLENRVKARQYVPRRSRRRTGRIGTA